MATSLVLKIELSGEQQGTVTIATHSDATVLSVVQQLLRKLRACAHLWL